MSLFSSRSPRRRGPGGPGDPWPHEKEQSGQTQSSQDTLAAISELSRLVKNNPDLVEIYLALGNLFRAQGELERAVQIRTSLIVRPGLDPHFKARALCELGRDYKRAGFMGRALEAFEEAVRLTGEDQGILYELATLAAMGNDYQTAARRFGQLGNTVAQAHYLVRLAQKHFLAGEESQGRKMLQRALKVHPGSLEAWLERVLRAVAAENMKKTANLLREGFHAVPPNLRFVFLDGVLNSIMQQPAITPLNRNTPRLTQEHPVCSSLLPLLEKQEQGQQDVLCLYYGALLLLACGDRDLARAWLEKALSQREDFWPARLELITLGLDQQDLLPGFHRQLDLFIAQARSFKRFFCKACGVKRETVFFVCPRCQSWHSIGLRHTLQE